MIGASTERTSGWDWPGAAARFRARFAIRLTVRAGFGLFALASLLCQWACASGQPSNTQQEKLAFEQVSRGDWFAGARLDPYETTAYRLLVDRTQWLEFWRRRFIEPAPDVAFDEDFVVSVFQGTKPTGGFGIDILEVAFEPAGNTLHITLDIQEPRPGQAVDLGETSPYVIVRIRIPEDLAETLDPGAARMAFYQQTDSALLPLEAVELR